MSLLIVGLDMPTGYAKVELGFDANDTPMAMVGEEIYDVVQIPSHGRLIDADALREKFPEPNEKLGGWRNPDQAIVHKTGVWAEIDAAPTIIEKEV